MSSKKTLLNSLLVFIYAFVLSYVPAFLLGIDKKLSLIMAVTASIIGIISPGAGIFSLFIALFLYNLFKIPILAILLAPLYITLAVKSFRYWNITPLILLTFLIHIYYPSLAIFSLPLILLAMTFFEPQDSIVVSPIFAYSILISLFLLYPPNTTISSGVFIIETKTLPTLRPFETSFDYLMDVLITTSAILLKFSQTLLANDASGLIQIISFTASGFIASQIHNSGSSRIKRFSIIPLSMIPILIYYTIYRNNIAFLSTQQLMYLFSETLIISLLIAFLINRKEEKSKIYVPKSTAIYHIRKKERDSRIYMLEILLKKQIDNISSKPLLVIGPPGCGKTYFLKKAASNLNIYTYIVPKDTPEYLYNLLKEPSRKIIIIKEIQEKIKIINFLKNKHLQTHSLVFTSSNPLKLLDLFDLDAQIGEIVYIPPPDKSDIEKFLRKEIGNYVQMDYKKIVPLLKNYSYLQLKHIVSSILQYCSVISSINTCEIGYAEILDIIVKVKPDLTPQIYNNLEKFIMNSTKPIIRPKTLNTYSKT